ISRRFLSVSAVAPLFVCLALSAPASDWPQFRGPNRDGICPETGLLKDWPAEGPPLVWKATGLGNGFSTVSVVGKRIFTIGEKDGTSLGIALADADGESVWTAKLGQQGATGW